MANPRILKRNLADPFNGGTITASPALVTTLPETNLQNKDRNKTARSTSTASQDIKLSWATAQTLNMVALCFHNFTTAAQIRVRTYSDAAFTTLITDNAAANCFAYSGLSAAVVNTDYDFRIYKNSARFITAETTCKSMIITITDAANPDGYFDIARLYVGQYFEFAYMLGQGDLVLTEAEMSGMVANFSGGPTTDKAAKYRVGRLQHKWMTMAADYPEVRHIANHFGLTNDFFYTSYPGDGTLLELYDQGGFVFTDLPGPIRGIPALFQADFAMRSI